MNQKIRPDWFKCEQDISKQILEKNFSDESVGKGVKAALKYFDTREEDPSIFSDKDAYKVFALFEMKIDEAYRNYEERVENGKKGGRPTKRDSQKAILTEEEKEREEENEKEVDPSFLFREGDEYLSSLTKKGDGLTTRREALSHFGKGLVLISDDELRAFLKVLALDDFCHYVESIKNCIVKGKPYKRMTHAEAILKMAKKDGKLLSVEEQSESAEQDGIPNRVERSFDTQDFFNVALERSYGEDVQPPQ